MATVIDINNALDFLKPLEINGVIPGEVYAAMLLLLNPGITQQQIITASQTIAPFKINGVISEKVCNSFLQAKNPIDSTKLIEARNFLLNFKVANNVPEKITTSILKNVLTSVTLTDINNAISVIRNLTVNKVLPNDIIPSLLFIYSGKSLIEVIAAMGTIPIIDNYSFRDILNAQLLNLNTSLNISEIALDWKNRTIGNGGSVSDTTLNAVNDFINGCISDGIWSKLSLGQILLHASDNFNGLLTPLVTPFGANPSNSNLVNGDYGLTTGINPGNPNTSKSIATGFIPATHLFSNNSAQLSFYSRSNSKSSGYPGTMNVSLGGNRWLLCLNSTDNNSYFDCWDNGTGRFTVTIPNTLGLISSSRTANNDFRAYRNGVQVGSTNTNILSSSRALGQMLIFAPGGSDANVYETRICAYNYIGPGLTPTEELKHYNRVQTLQTALGRAV